MKVSLVHHPAPQKAPKSPLWWSATTISSVLSASGKIVQQLVFFIILGHGLSLLCPLPSDLVALGRPISLISVCWSALRGGRGWGETTIKKQVSRPHAERIVRGRSPRGTVLSNGICAIHFAWECRRGGAENNLQSEGGGRLEEVKTRGSQLSFSCFFLVFFFTWQTDLIL